jgi:1-acyl-sn-glycerol-3-phosphate acyltransferase
VTGAEHVPASGGVLVVANHPSDIDPILVAISVRRPLRFMADAVQFQRGFVGPAVRLLGAFPVRVASPDVTAVRTALELLEAGEAVALFPEGDVVPQSLPAPTPTA